jgi:hypothetical protein
MPYPTFERANELLRYDPESGKLFWRVDRRRVKAGDEAGSIAASKSGGTLPYCRLEVGIDGTVYRAHRVIWLLVTGSLPSECIDHKDGDPLNNRWENLRTATQCQNMRNMTRNSRNTSGAKGVSWSKPAGKWRARIRINGVETHLGVYSNIEDAREAYAKAAYDYYGPYACVDYATA